MTWSASDFPRIVRGTQWWQTHARQWQNLFDVVLRLANFTVGPGLSLSKRGKALTLHLSSNVAKPQPTQRRVAIQSVGDTSLTVREVRYKSKPPTDGDLDWYGAPFDAWPDVGSALQEFGAYVVDGDEVPSHPPTFMARRVADEWFVEPSSIGGDQIRLMVLTGAGANSRTLTAHQVTATQPQLGFPWDATWTVTGEAEDLYVWPNMRSSDFGPLFAPDGTAVGSVLGEAVNIIPAIWYDGRWMLPQWLRWALGQPDGEVPHGDCVP